MEALILGWYVLVETGSVVMLTSLGALRFIGTLLSPLFGLAGDRLGRRRLQASMRAFYAFLAALIMVLGLTETLRPELVLVVALAAGLVSPSDIVMRNSLIGDTMPKDGLTNAVGLSRISMDSARIFGALTGAGLFSVLGIGRAYAIVVGIYLLSFALTLGIKRIPPRLGTDGSPPPSLASHWRELKEGFRQVWTTPTILAVMCLAFLINLTAFPLSHGLLPFVAKEIYHVDENGLGHLVAGFASGAAIGSMTLAVLGSRVRSSRFMLVNVLLWYAMLAIFAGTGSKAAGFPTLLIMGIFHSMAMVSMSVTLLGVMTDEFRGRIMGVRMLAVYGVPSGLMISGPLIGWLGFQGTAAIYVGIGVLFTLIIGYKWRRVLWY
jgi:predicted MFS family arabinose efflux permease